MLLFLLTLLASPFLAHADGESYPYKASAGDSGVQMGTHMALAVPQWILLLVMLGMVSFIGFLAYRLLNLDTDKKKKSKKGSTKKKKRSKKEQ
mmetsp:Transcript_8682/g.11934  ORF Transcript_8682/g.11934 Transcript_8682/m.11934 type:complete len:93 (-) Transcript_8682:416-694(-)